MNDIVALSLLPGVAAVREKWRARGQAHTSQARAEIAAAEAAAAARAPIVDVPTPPAPAGEGAGDDLERSQALPTERERRASIVRPLAERMCHRHHCRKSKNGSPYRVDEPFTETLLSEHVTGGQAVGLYPMEPGGDITAVACFDLDSHKGEIAFDVMRAHAERILAVLRRRGCHGHPFRSSGGKGIHIYLIWDTSQDAFSVREMMRATLEECGLRVGAGGVSNGEIEAFPKQDSVQADRCGNMFVLPLTGKSEPIGTFEGWTSSDDVVVVERPAPERVTSETPVDLKRLESAIDAIPDGVVSVMNYDEWWRHVASIHAEAGDEGLWLAEKFSAKSPKHDEGFLESRIWPYLRDDRAGVAITGRTIYGTAMANGWQDPSALDAFEVLELAPPAPQPRTARALLTQEFKPLRWVVPKILPEGVYLLVAAPKIGKSWLALQAVLAVASGGELLGERAEPGAALYLALEDNDRRLQSRLRSLNADLVLTDAQLDAVQFETQWRRSNEGGADAIAAWVQSRSNARLVVVDVLERFRPMRSAKGNLYQEDYAALQALKRIADQHRVAILVVHHTRKGATDDPLAMVSGTQGLAGAADGMIMLERGRGETRGRMHVIVRDIEDDGEFIVEFAGCEWGMVGPARAVASTIERQEILDTLNEAGGGPLSGRDIAEALGKKRTTVARLLTKMANEGVLIWEDHKYTAALALPPSNSSNR